MLKPAIFLHSSWRTGSTYVWAKFRPLREFYCYFEPLNEHLVTATESFINTFAPWSYATHPKLDAPYLDEFRALLGSSGGLDGFPAELTYGHYVADRTGYFPDLEAYFARLDGFAKAQRKIPVFGCVRTNLRIDWFCHRLRGVHIFILRNHRRQFISYLNQAVNGNRYFLERVWVILGRNKDDPRFEPLRKLIEIPAYDGPGEDHDRFYARQAWNTPWPELYTIFYFLHLLEMKNLGVANIDLLIDLDALTAYPDKAAGIERKLTALTGAAISFSDCHIEMYQPILDGVIPSFERLECQIGAALNEIHNQSLAQKYI